MDLEYDFERELALSLEASDIDDGFNHLYKEFIKSQEHKRWAPAWTGQAILDAPEQKVMAYVPGFIYAGCIAAIAGPPKAGKSTFVWSMLHELMAGKSFLGESCKVPDNVLYISEQGRFSFKNQLKRLPEGMGENILRNRKFFVMLPEHHLIKRVNNLESVATTWQERLELWRKAIKATQADLLILDTFGMYADLGAQGENDNATLNKRMLELRSLINDRQSLAILLICHTNKASGAHGRFLMLRDVRGGSALAGALDHGVTFNKFKTGNARFISVESRMIGDSRRIVIWNENGTFGDLTDASIRDIQEILEISYRRARRLKQQILGDFEPENDSEGDSNEDLIPSITRT